MSLVINWGAGFTNGPIEHLRIKETDGVELADNGIFFVVIRKEETEIEKPEECLIIKIGYNNFNNEFIIKMSRLVLLPTLESIFKKEIIVILPAQQRRKPKIIKIPCGVKDPKERRKKWKLLLSPSFIAL